MNATQTQDAFTEAYIDCALWATNDESDETGGQPMIQNFSIHDLAPETLERMTADCEKFQQDNAELLAVYGLGDEQAGHDFWLSRNGHGAGFFDRSFGHNKHAREDAADKLQNICRNDWPQIDLYVGDDGKIYLF